MQGISPERGGSVAKREGDVEIVSCTRNDEVYG